MSETCPAVLCCQERRQVQLTVTGLHFFITHSCPRAQAPLSTCVPSTVLEPGA